MKRYCIITIEREYASGGSLVGKLVGQALGVPVYGREILEIAAREGGTTPEYIEHLEETDTNSLLYSLVAMAKTVQGQLPQISKTDQLNLLEARIIQRLAQEGPCVIVGRCADYVLRDRGDLLSIFVHAALDIRVKRIMKLQNLSEDKARAYVVKADKKRGNYYNFYTGKDWSRADSYDFCIDAGKLGIRGAERMIEEIVRLADLGYPEA